MKFCSITPVGNAELMYEEDVVMLLAHLAEKNDEYVCNAFHSKKYKIIDNSIIEMGRSFSMKRLVAQAVRCRADEIILPDEFENGSLTIEKTIKSIRWLKRKGLIGKFKLMAVCHGRTLEEFKACFKLLNLITEIDVIGIPKITQKWCGNRGELAGVFLDSQKEIHFLGCYDSLEELLLLRSNPRAFSKVRSIDTCLPSLLAMEGKGCWESREGKKIDLEKDLMSKEELHRYRQIIFSVKKEMRL